MAASAPGICPRGAGADEGDAEFETAKNQQRGHEQHRDAGDVPKRKTWRKWQTLAGEMDPQHHRPRANTKQQHVAGSGKRVPGRGGASRRDINEPAREQAVESAHGGLGCQGVLMEQAAHAVSH